MSFTQPIAKKNQEAINWSCTILIHEENWNFWPHHSQAKQNGVLIDIPLFQCQNYVLYLYLGICLVPFVFVNVYPGCVFVFVNVFGGCVSNRY